MKLRDILAGAEIIESTVSPETDITDVVFDSRAVTPGALFAAVPGTKEDGAKYVPMALERGAAAVLAERPIDGAPCVVVKSVRREMIIGNVP